MAFNPHTPTTIGTLIRLRKRVGAVARRAHKHEHGENLLGGIRTRGRPPALLLPPPPMVSSQLATQPSIGQPAQRLSRQRFSAMAHS